MTMETMETKLKRLQEFIREFDSVAIAFSGGVDSSTLAALCKKVLGDNVLAVTVASQTVPSRELDLAKNVAREVGVRHKILEIDILKDRNFVKNDERRCYYCKREILKEILEFSRKLGYQAVFEGTNAEDLKGHRPGYEAVREIDGVYSPWAEFGFSKEEIRRLAKEMRLSFYLNPPLACLASRIPFGTPINHESLRMIDEAEEAVIELCGVEQVRVRKLGDFAVVEVDRGDIEGVASKSEILCERLKKMGFNRIFLDMEGYRSGKGMDLKI
jgi:uncharacterized protein